MRVRLVLSTVRSAKENGCKLFSFVLYGFNIQSQPPHPLSLLLVNEPISFFGEPIISLNEPIFLPSKALQPSLTYVFLRLSTPFKAPSKHNQNTTPAPSSQHFHTIMLPFQHQHPQKIALPYFVSFNERMYLTIIAASSRDK